MHVLRPNGGETWPPGGTADIAWEGGGEAVDLQLLKGRTVVRTISTRATNDGAHGWLIPTGLTPGDDYGVRVSTPGGTVDDSDAPFSVGALSIADCFPVTPHRAWTYQDANGASVHLAVLADVRELEGVPVTVLADETGRQEWYSLDEAGLYLHRIVLAGDEPATLTFRPPLHIAPAQLEPGAEVRGTGIVETVTGEGAPESEPYQCVVEVESLPVITVPAGRFSTAKLSGILLLGPEQRVLFTLWLAPGVGRVQHTGDRSLKLIEERAAQS